MISETERKKISRKVDGTTNNPTGSSRARPTSAYLPLEAVIDPTPMSLWSGVEAGAAALQSPGPQNKTWKEADLFTLHARYHPPPIVTLSKAVPGHPMAVVENEAGELYGLDRLCQVVKERWGGRAEEVKDAIVADVRGYIGEQKVLDGITLVVRQE